MVVARRKALKQPRVAHVMVKAKYKCVKVFLLYNRLVQRVMAAAKSSKILVASVMVKAELKRAKPNKQICNEYLGHYVEYCHSYMQKFAVTSNLTSLARAIIDRNNGISIQAVLSFVVIESIKKKTTLTFPPPSKPSKYSKEQVLELGLEFECKDICRAIKGAGCLPSDRQIQ